MTLRAVILNDTSTRYHHGCARVMRLLVEGLERHGLTVTARSPARHDWASDAGFLDAMRAAHVIVVNGEGTLHHGRPAGARLLDLGGHPARGDRPLVLVNALWQDNPESWSAPLSRFDLIAARDSASARSMSEASGQEVRWLPDLSLSAPARTVAAPRHGVIVGDSVKPGPRRVLGRAASHLSNATLVPTKTLSGGLWRFAPARAALAAAWYGGLGLPPLEMPANETAYLDRIARAELHITGRFHAVCLSMLTETPFLALGSNASKIERLLADADLGPERLLHADALSPPPETAAFTQSELSAIRAFREMARRRADTLYADIAALAGGAS
ncbi:polysaccharide pyruvyl transferase family protein [Limimaricola sp. G21655-S1]|uniref:polysaccharide pyruvyl transferase family protein n=1 Tax=Limimaricola sp. G21655-S1 TaxID=3014768 RepID=UPI0022AE819B|nr:polysaccharide pyruvyl transferase family protein [Limimaricola sp. G21655-S1]MCZ4262921.1 polysaccharide pyruvyl transferase family protein [Limimaricola sp. G21655-S1]